MKPIYLLITVLVFLSFTSCSIGNRIQSVEACYMGATVKVTFYPKSEDFASNPSLKNIFNKGKEFYSEYEKQVNEEDITNQCVWKTRLQGGTTSTELVDNIQATVISSKSNYSNNIIGCIFNEPGTYRMVAMVKHDNIAPSKQDFADGKFQVFLGTSNNISSDWLGGAGTSVELSGSANWTPVEAVVTKTDQGYVILRYGLQCASGTLYVSNLHVYRGR